jgi:hypothetical protein
MKWLYSLLLVSATSLSAQTKAPLRPSAIATMSAATKTINFKLSWTQTSVVDSTMVAVFLSRDTVPVLYRRTKPIDTVSFTIPDDTTTYRFLLVSIRRGLASLPANVNYFFNADVYYQPVGLDIYPKDTITVNAGETVQFCAFLKFNDGTTLFRQREKDIPKCVQYYNALPAASKWIGGAKQRTADKLCIRWQLAAGDMGSIVPEVCSPIQ